MSVIILKSEARSEVYLGYITLGRGRGDVDNGDLEVSRVRGLTARRCRRRRGDGRGDSLRSWACNDGSGQSEESESGLHVDNECTMQSKTQDADEE